MQEKQLHIHLTQEMKQVLVISATCSDAYQIASLTSLMHTLRLVHGPLLWIIVEAGNTSGEVGSLLASSGLPFLHMSYQSPNSTSKAGLWTEGLRYIHVHRIEGIVMFADENMVYNLNFFNDARKVKLMGAFWTSSSSFPGIQGGYSTNCEDAHGLRTLISSLTNSSSNLSQSHGPCSSSFPGVCGYSFTSNLENIALLRSMKWSDFVLDASLLWGDDNISRVKNLRELFAGNQTMLQNPLDLIMNVSQIEPLGRCIIP
ncbi:hypothetical protein KP509_07G046300 [Ceratopteris richardii]|nr:hypothetical protein KP509_07G046300 [Ceratopteris richardii]